MHFYFPGRTTCLQLDHVIATVWKMLAAHGVDEVDDVQISFTGWRAGHRCFVADENGELSHVVFDRLADDDTPVDHWRPRPGFRIYNLQKPRSEPTEKVKANWVG